MAHTPLPGGIRSNWVNFMARTYAPSGVPRIFSREVLKMFLADTAEKKVAQLPQKS